MLYLLVVFIIVQRLLELRVARRNLRWALSKGGREYAPEHYPFMVALHTAWILALLLEGIARGGALGALWPVWLTVFALAQLGRYWVISTLGTYWNTRIVIIPGGERVRRGPFRFFEHPNYLVVAVELFCAPMIFGAWGTAVVFTLLNAWLLLGVRIPAEERALEAYRSSQG